MEKKDEEAKEQEELNRLEVTEKLSHLEAYSENPFKFKPLGVFNPDFSSPKLSIKEEKEQLKAAKIKLEEGLKNYKTLLKKKHAEDIKNLEHFRSVRNNKKKSAILQEECRDLQARNKIIEEEGKKRVALIAAKTKELKDSVTKSVNSIQESIEKDENILKEKEKEWAELNDSLAKARKHRELQLQQKEAVNNANKLQAQIADTKGAQREQAMLTLQKKREIQMERLKEKVAKHAEYEELLINLKERNKSVKDHLAENLPVYKGYLEKEKLLTKQLELLRQREASAQAAVRLAEAQAIQSALEPDQVAKIRAINATKAMKAKELREQIKARSAGGSSGAKGLADKDYGEAHSSGSASGVNDGGSGGGSKSSSGSI